MNGFYLALVVLIGMNVTNCLSCNVLPNDSCTMGWTCIFEMDTDEEIHSCVSLQHRKGWSCPLPKSSRLLNAGSVHKTERLPIFFQRVGGDTDTPETSRSSRRPRQVPTFSTKVHKLGSAVRTNGKTLTVSDCN